MHFCCAQSLLRGCDRLAHKMVTLSTIGLYSSLLCNLYGPGLGFSVRTKPWCRFRCVHAPLAQRRPRRGATLYSSIGASGRGSRFIKVGRDLHSSNEELRGVPPESTTASACCNIHFRSRWRSRRRSGARPGANKRVGGFKASQPTWCGRWPWVSIKGDLPHTNHSNAASPSGTTGHLR